MIQAGKKVLTCVATLLRILLKLTCPLHPASTHAIPRKWLGFCTWRPCKWWKTYGVKPFALRLSMIPSIISQSYSSFSREIDACPNDRTVLWESTWMTHSSKFLEVLASFIHFQAATDSFSQCLYFYSFFLWSQTTCIRKTYSPEFGIFSRVPFFCMDQMFFCQVCENH